MKFILCLALCLSLCSLLPAQQTAPEVISTEQFSREVTNFLGREIAAHVADVHSLGSAERAPSRASRERGRSSAALPSPGKEVPPQERVLGALTTGEFSWGTFMRALASCQELTGERTIAGKDVAGFIGQIGLIESKHGGKTFAQLYAALALRSFGTDLNTNPVWHELTPSEQDAWRSLLDPTRFYDPKTRRVINLPENYFGVAARVVTMDYQLGIITDRAFVDDVLNRAAEQFTNGALYSDDNIPTGRYDRYSNEYVRYVYEAAENVGRKDLMQALEPSLKAQMRTWWDLLSPDGYGYPWGRSLGVISYIDTMEIVGFLGRHSQFRPAPLAQLASAYYAAWQSLMKNYQPERHLLNVFGFGHGNYSYINLEREWQQTTAFFGKVAGAHKNFVAVIQAEHLSSFPARLQLPNLARFEFFRKGARPAGVWLVRQKEIRFILPVTTGTRPGVSDYLPAPYDLTGFAPPVEQRLPTVTPYLELTDGRVIVAADGADEIVPSEDGNSLHAVWRKWALVEGKPGETVDPGLATEVSWNFSGNTLHRFERITASRPVRIKRFWVAIPSTATTSATSYEEGHRVDTLKAEEGSLQVAVDRSSFPLDLSLQATGNSPLGKGSRGPVPLILNLEAQALEVNPQTDIEWSLSLHVLANSSITLSGQPAFRDNHLSRSNNLKIKDAKVIVCSPGRNFVTLKITTDEGIFGLGDATLNGRELAVASYLTDHVLPLLIGRDARKIEDTWQYLYKGAYWRRGPVTMSAISAVDTALWDIRARSLNVPLYQLMGGASRDGVLVYGHASGADLNATVDAVGKYLNLGYKAIRAQSGIPGMKSTYGVGRGDMYYEPAEKDAPPENLWSTEHYLNFAPQLFARLRKEFGSEIHLLHDAHHRLTPIEAARLGKELEPYHLFWLEDPTPAELQEGFRLIRRHTTTPLAVGEVFDTIYDCHTLIQEQLIDYIRTTVVHVGGISHLRKIAALAELYHVRTGSHGATDLSPVCMAAALHFDLSVHNFGIQEYMRHSAETDKVFPHSYLFKDGYMHPGDQPGLGVDIDEKVAAQFPYRRAYLPVNRKLDGTMHSW